MNSFMPFGIQNFYNPSGMFNFFSAFNPFVMPQIPKFNIFRPFSFTPFQNVQNFGYPSIFNNNYSRPFTNATTCNTNSVDFSQTTSKPKVGQHYNKTKGENLAQKIVENLPTDRDPNNPLCAKFVKNAVQDCGLGEYINGNGAYCKNIFRANSNFKEIKTKDFSKLPAGSIVVYDAFAQLKYPDGSTGQAGKDGHVIVALGDGRGCSDILEDQIAYSKNAYTFIPV